MTTAALTFEPLTPDRWDDLEQLFGPERGGNSGCWCLWWRIRKPEWDRLGKPGRKRQFRAVVAAGEVPGLLAYQGGRPVGWCAIAPRTATPRLNTSRVAAPTDPVTAGDWAITCFYIASEHRQGGLMRSLIEAAVTHARRHGAKRVDACPIEPRRKLMWGEGFVGIASAFRRAGFVEVERRSETRILMRRDFET
ncbi:MAG: GNAT family N-acetyltransferase [Hyphomicrobiaceae bacterium]